MASARNNRFQEQRAALRDQQKRERETAEAAFRALDDEYQARLTAAQAVASVVDLSGKERAAALLGLELKDVTAYVRLAGDSATPDAVSDKTATEIPEQSSATADATV